MLHVLAEVLIRFSVVLAWVLVAMRVADILMRDRPDDDWIYWTCILALPLPLCWLGLGSMRRRSEPVPQVTDPPQTVIRLAEQPPRRPGQGLLKRKPDTPPVVLRLPSR